MHLAIAIIYLFGGLAVAGAALTQILTARTQHKMLESMSADWHLKTAFAESTLMLAKDISANLEKYVDLMAAEKRAEAGNFGIPPNMPVLSADIPVAYLRAACPDCGGRRCAGGCVTADPAGRAYVGD